ncbi:MAG TPA: hypothetical protein VF037_08795 [Gemmatimonadales bacterium]
MRRKLSRAACLGLALIAAAAGACERAPDSAATAAPPRPRWTGFTFDPATLRPGDQVGPYIVDSAAIVRAESLGTWVGVVRFRGTIPLRGRRIPHFDPEVRATCFEADSATGRRLPRWPDDERRPWFCFENDTTAARVLADTDTSKPVDIAVDRFTTVRAFTDAVNSARLLEGDACFRSAAILGRLGPVPDSTPGAGWLRFHRGLIGDSGLVRLVERNGATVSAAWARRARGALELRGADDFMRFEALLARRGDSLVGEARLHTDAQLERDSGGRLLPSERKWLLAAGAAPCDSAPRPWQDAR